MATSSRLSTWWMETWLATWESRVAADIGEERDAGTTKVVPGPVSRPGRGTPVGTSGGHDQENVHSMARVDMR